MLNSTALRMGSRCGAAAATQTPAVAERNRADGHQADTITPSIQNQTLMSSRDMMRLMRITKLLLPLALSMTILATAAEVIVNGRPSVVLESPAAKLVIDLGGGSIVDFHSRGGGLNPLRWIGAADVNAALRPMAHFLCLDRWGPLPRRNSAMEWFSTGKPHGSDGRSSIRRQRKGGVQ